MKPLVEAMCDPSSNVNFKKAALNAVKKIRPYKSIAISLTDLLSEPRFRKAATEMLVAIGEPAVLPLIETLRNERRIEPLCNAAYALGEIGDTRALLPLILAIVDHSARVNENVAAALGKIIKSKKKIEVEPLIKALADLSRRSKMCAVEVLGDSNNEKAVEPLIKLLKDPDKGIKIEAVRSLGKLGGSKVLDTLIELLNDPNEDIKSEAIKGLGKVGDSKTVMRYLNPFLQDDGNIKNAAIGAIAEISLREIDAMREERAKQIKSHHFPRHIRLAVKEKLKQGLRQGQGARGKGQGIQLTDVEIDELIDGKGLAQFAPQGRETIKKVSPAILFAVADALRDVVSKDKKITPRKVDAVLEFHEKLHELIHRNPHVIDNIKKRLKDKLGQEGFDKVREEFENNYVHYKTEDEFIEELIVNYYQEGLIFGNQVRILPDILPLEKAEQLPQYMERIKSSRNELDEAINDVIESQSKDVSIEIKMLVYNSPLKREYLIANGIFDEDILKLKDPVNMLIRNLGGSKMFLAQLAAKALGEIGDPRAVEPLIRALNNSDGRIRNNAVVALGKIGDPRAVEPLIRVLGDANVDMKLAAVKALSQIGEPSIDPLIKALQTDPDSHVRAFSAKTLGDIGDPRAIEPLIEAFGDPHNLTEFKVKDLAVKALVKIGEPSIDPLITTGLGSSNEHVRQYAIVALGDTRSPRAVEPLAKLLEDPSEEFKEDVISSLGEIGDVAAVKYLNPFLDDSDKRLIETATSAIADIALKGIEQMRITRELLAQKRDAKGYSETTEIMKRLGKLGENTPGVVIHDIVKQRQISPANLMAEITEETAERESGSGEHLEYLLRLKDGRWEISKGFEAAAVEVGTKFYHKYHKLGEVVEINPAGDKAKIRFGEGANAFVQEMLIRDPNLTIIRSVKPIDTEVDNEIAILIKSLGDKSEKVRTKAMNRLVEIGYPCIGELIATTTVKHWGTRWGSASAPAYWAVRTIGLIKDNRALPSLIGIINSRDRMNSDVRVAAIWALGEIGDPSAVDPLIKKLDIFNGKIEPAIVDALVKIGKPSSEPLIKSLSNPRWRGRHYAIRALGKLGDRTAVDYLNPFLKDPDEGIREVAIEVIAEISMKEIDQMRTQRQAQEIKAAELAEASL